MNTIFVKNSKLSKLAILAAVSIASILAFATCYTLYIDPSTIRTDQYEFMQDYMAWKSGDLTWGQLWESKGGHRLTGYALIFLINAELFNYDPIIEILLSHFVLGFVCFYFSRSMGREILERPSPVLAAIFIVVMVSVFFNAQVIQLSIYSLIAMRAFNFSIFLIIAYWFYLDIFDPRQFSRVFRIFAYLSGVIFLLVFGRGWGMAAVMAIFASLLMFLLASSGNLKEKGWRVLTLPILAIIAYFLIYLHDLSGSAAPDQSFDLRAFLKFYLLKLGSAQTSIISFKFGKIAWLSFSVGVITVLLIALWSICLFLGKSHSRNDWLAYYILMFCCAACGVVAVSRYTGNPYFPRHNLEISMMPIGQIWFIMKYGGKLKLPGMKFISGAVTVFLGVFVLLGLQNTAEAAKFQRSFYNSLKKKFAVALYPDRAPAVKRPLRCPLTTDQDCQDVYKALVQYDITTGAVKKTFEEPKAGN